LRRRFHRALRVAWTTTGRALGHWRFSRAVTNPIPDAATRTAGAHSGAVLLGAGDGFTWEYDVNNDSDVVLKYSNAIHTGEMCNVFGVYANEQRDDRVWTCVF
jgi:hypothetical protein